MSKRYILNDRQEALYRSAPRLVTPSRPTPWEGSYPEGERFTDRQIAELRRLGRDPATADYLDVEAPGDPRRIYITERTAISFREVVYFYRRIPCPIIGTRGDRLKVIAPSGDTKFVYPNGQLSRARAA